VISHNPAIHELALKLAGPVPELLFKSPTAALATLTFDGSAWGSSGPKRPSWSSSPGRATSDPNPLAEGHDLDRPWQTPGAMDRRLLRFRRYGFRADLARDRICLVGKVVQPVATSS
jgi:hypothetical protein